MFDKLPVGAAISWDTINNRGSGVITGLAYDPRDEGFYRVITPEGFPRYCHRDWIVSVCWTGKVYSPIGQSNVCSTCQYQLSCLTKAGGA